PGTLLHLRRLLTMSVTNVCRCRLGLPICMRSRRPPPNSTLFPYTTLFRSHHLPDLTAHQVPDQRRTDEQRQAERRGGGEDRPERQVREHMRTRDAGGELLCDPVEHSMSARGRGVGGERIHPALQAVHARAP